MENEWLELAYINMQSNSQPPEQKQVLKGVNVTANIVAIDGTCYVRLETPSGYYCWSRLDFINGK